MDNASPALLDDGLVLREVLLNAREAFELFDRQNTLLESSFEHLEHRLEDSAGKLEQANSVLSDKVQELQRALGKLHGILESMADGVLVINSEGYVELCNPVAQSMLGVTQGRLYSEIFPPLQQYRLNLVLENGQANPYREFEFDGPDSQRMVLQSSIAPVCGVDGKTLGAVEIFRDMTELRQLERQVKHQRHMAALGEMASGVAHEMRNPLGAIEGFARLLKGDLERQNLPQFSRMAERIVEGTENLNYVITSLLDYARPVRLEYKMFPVQPLMDDLRDYLAGKLHERQVDLYLESPGPEMQMNGDQRQLRHVLINLGRNAVEACETNSGGRVRVGFHLCHGEVSFKIVDNGCGISPENLEKIFDPFFTTKHDGTGLGLSFCHKMIEAHGGEIFAHSDANNGTVFKVVIPQWRNAR